MLAKPRTARSGCEVAEGFRAVNATFEPVSARVVSVSQETGFQARRPSGRKGAARTHGVSAETERGQPSPPVAGNSETASKSTVARECVVSSGRSYVAAEQSIIEFERRGFDGRVFLAVNQHRQVKLSEFPWSKPFADAFDSFVEGESSAVLVDVTKTFSKVDQHFKRI
jgi:hypothetical protein